MEPETSTTLVPTRCAHCGGSLRADAPWCTLCLTPTRPTGPAEPDPEPQPQRVRTPVVASPAGAVDPLTAPLELLLAGSTAEPTWPCTSCSATNPFSLSDCATCGAGFLAAVARDEPPLLVLPLVGDVTDWSKLRWFGAGLVLLLGVLSLIVVVGAVLG